MSDIVDTVPAGGPTIPVSRLQLIGGRGARAVQECVVQLAAGRGFTKLASQYLVAEEVCDHGDVGVMGVGDFPGHHQAENEVDRLTVRSIEIYRIRQLDHRRNAAVDTLNATMREGNAGVQAGAAEAFTLNETFEYVVRGNILL